MATERSYITLAASLAWKSATALVLVWASELAPVLALALALAPALVAPAEASHMSPVLVPPSWWGLALASAPALVSTPHPLRLISITPRLAPLH